MSYGVELAPIAVPDCDVYVTGSGRFVDMHDERAKYCGRTRESENLVLQLQVFEAACQQHRLLTMDELALVTEGLDECNAALELGMETVEVTTDYGDEMEKYMKAERIKYGLIGAGAGSVITIILLMIAMFAG